MINRAGIYILLILIYLGVSKGFSNRSDGDLFFRNEEVFANYFNGSGAPLSVLLDNYFDAGFFIKSHYHVYKIVYGFKNSPRYLTARVSTEFYDKYKPYLGMSIFRRNTTDFKEETLPMPPGILYVGDLAFGNWVYKDSGAKGWRFHKAYRNFPQIFSWGQFRPDYEFFKSFVNYEERNQPFFGNEKEFGTEGKITKTIYHKFFSKDLKEEFTLNQYVNKLLETRSKWIHNE